MENDIKESMHRINKRFASIDKKSNDILNIIRDVKSGIRKHRRTERIIEIAGIIAMSLIAATAMVVWL